MKKYFNFFTFADMQQELFGDMKFCDIPAHAEKYTTGCDFDGDLIKFLLNDFILFGWLLGKFLLTI